VTASTTTTIRRVSIFSRQRKADVFDIVLSPDGIVVQRPGRSDQRMGWDRISEWEIEERPDCVVLTLRGEGSVTPLMVKGWTLENLETVMRNVTEGSTGPGGEAGAPVTDAAPAADGVGDGVTPAAAAAHAVEPPGEPVATPPLQSRVARRQAARRPRRGPWKSLVTIVLLGALATAVTVVLLQSAGVIDWSFLGPVA
jgi:hypothetical protein